MSDVALKSTPRHGVARLVSVVLHPILLPLLTLGVLVVYSPYGSPRQAIYWVTLGLFITAIPVAALVLVQVVRGRWTDTDVSVRRDRYALYPFGIACLVAAVTTYVAMRAPQVVVRAVIAAVVANTINWIINLRYKVSGHATTAALCAALLWFGIRTPDSTLWGGAASLAALLVGWSRVVLGRHTRGQVVLGWGVGVASGIAAMLVPWPLILGMPAF
jgi:membrane-associated phospholipid phosphatase